MSTGKIFDYSKWDKIELSDDESDLHPNIDKDSWFRMKHRARLEREEKEDADIKIWKKQNAEGEGRLSVIRARLNGLQSGQAEEDAEFEDVEALKCEAEEIENQISGKNSLIEEMMERRKWNIDNICKVVDEKTIVNSATAKSLRAEDFAPTGITEQTYGKDSSTEEGESSTVFHKAEASASSAVETSGNAKPNTLSASAPVTKSTTAAAVTAPAPVIGPKETTDTPKSRERFAVMSYNDFVLTHENCLETYSEIRDIEATKEYLFKHCDVLLHEHAQSYMLLSSLEDEMNGKHDRMKLVCRQSQILTHITELGTSMHRDPRDVILPFFRRISEPGYLKGFAGAVEEFMQKIEKRAVEKRKEMDRERRQEEGQAAIGPGGLDPMEVFEELPVKMREAFESQDISELHKVLAEMGAIEAKKWMKKCVDSGLWVPKDSSTFDDDGVDNDDNHDQEGDGEEDADQDQDRDSPAETVSALALGSSSSSGGGGKYSEDDLSPID